MVDDAFVASVVIGIKGKATRDFPFKWRIIDQFNF